MKKLFFLFIFISSPLLFISSPLLAQPVANPRFVEFIKSADHDVVLPDSQPAVTRYEFASYHSGTTEPYQRQTIGKPVPDATGKCRVDISAMIIALPPSGIQEWFARIIAVGPMGEGVSENSNPFYVVGPPGGPSSVVLKSE